MRGPLVVLGDALLDRDLDGTVDRLCPDAPVPVVDDPEGRARPGGAALAASLAARHGDDVVLVTAVADDEPGEELRGLLADAGVEVVPLRLDPPTPEKVRVRAAGRPLLRLDRGARPKPPGAPTDRAQAALRGAGAVLVSDYGRGLTAQPELRRALEELGPRVPVVWDPHPRGAEPTCGVRLATPNASEVTALSDGASLADRSQTSAMTMLARRLVERWSVGSVAVTMGERGALLVGSDGPPMAIPAAPAEGSDPCGAGDRFAAAAATALRRGALTSEAVVEAVAAASRFVAGGGAAGLGDGGGPPPTYLRAGDGAVEICERVRSAGGTVVATGGCFDLLHAGHVGMLQAARRLGDCLVVCLNSDASVRRLKGPDRPLQPAEDRAAVLRALDCVDEVVVFDDDTPVALLERLKPHIFAKGADYAVIELPEARALAAWHGQAVVLPYLPGRSTTQIIDLAHEQVSSLVRREPRAR